MSFSSLVAAAAVGSTLPARTEHRAPSAPAGRDAVAVDTLPASPPPEVRDAMQTAAAAWQRLADSGQMLRFGVDASSGRVSAALTDASGSVLRRLTGSQTLAFAQGD